MKKNNSPPISQWITNFQRTTYPQPSSGLVDPTTSNYVGDLVIEDLDLCDLELSSSSARTSLSSTTTATSKNAHNFGNLIPGVVSEACTQNNLYILVRVPTSGKKLARTASTCSQTTPRMSDRSPSPHLNANRWIFPIPEEEAVNTFRTLTSSEHKKATCWTKDSEVKEEFTSRTNIVHETTPCFLPNQVPDATEHVEEFVIPAIPPTPIRCQNQIELQELNLKSINLKGPTNVTLENYGILITPTKMPKTDNLLVFQVDTEADNDLKQSNYCSCFQWLRKFFQIGQGKSDHLVHAKVYKTYFVKWKKYPDEKECSCSKELSRSQRLRRNST